MIHEEERAEQLEVIGRWERICGGSEEICMRVRDLRMKTLQTVLYKLKTHRNAREN